MTRSPTALLPRSRRALSGGAITLIGVVLLGIPVYDIWDDVSDLQWAVVTTLVENATFLLLASGIALGGIWLIRSDWRTHHVAMVAKWTVGGWITASVLFGWVVWLQLQAMGGLKPYVLAMDGVLIGTAVTFGIGLLSARTHMQRSQLLGERAAKESLESLHEIATRLQEAEHPEEAYETALDGIEVFLSPDVARVVVDEETVRERSYSALPDEDGTLVTTPVGDRGRIELLDGGFGPYDEQALELLGTHLDRALERIAREQDLADERDRLAFINRTLRHELRNDVQVLIAHLDAVGEQSDPPERHWTTVRERTEKISEFVERMRAYMHLVERDAHELEAVDLRTTLKTEVETVRNAHASAEITLEDVPDVEVRADALLGPVFENLLRNAVLHNDEETPEVRVGCQRGAETVTVEVADNGPGIPAEHRRILEEGGRLDDDPESGFGLQLATEAIDAYGGELRVRNNDPRGTIMRVTLPLA